MSCRCHSYNWEIGVTPPKIMTPPWENARDVSIDACIAPVIEYLWEKGVVTINSCCGHNKQPPSIILPDGTTDEEARKIRELISIKDERAFDLLCWKLVKLDENQ